MIAAVLCSGIELEGARELHPELALGRQDLEELRVILEIGTRAIAPRVAFALTGRNTEIVTHLPMHPLGDRLRGLDREAVHVERLGVLAGVLQRCETLVASSPTVTIWNATTSTSPRLDRAEVVGDTQTLASFLTWEVEARELARELPSLAYASGS